MPITASENPIGVYGAGASGSTMITWSTASATTRGRVYKIFTENGVMSEETVFDGDTDTGELGGSMPLTLRLGVSCRLQLRRANNNVILATLNVTTWDVTELLQIDSARGVGLIDALFPPQEIYDLKVQAGIDTCRIRFKTTQATIPLVQASDSDGTNVGSAFPLFGGLRTQHEMLLGEVTALPQGTRLELKIVAAGHNLNGKATETVVNTAFVTGKRMAVVAFQEIDVRKDGDPNSAGDFTWHFEAGDADNGAELSFPGPRFDLDISDDDPPVAINETISIDLAPRNLCIGAEGADDDLTIPYPGQGLSIHGYPGLTGDRTGAGEIPNDVEYAWVTRVFDIAELSNGTVVPMELATGNFGVAFTIKGTITIRTVAGVSPRHPGFDIWDSPRLVTQFPKAGVTKKLSGKLWARGADGAIYLKDSAVQGGNEGWKVAARPVDGVVTLVGVSAERAVLFALDGEGAVIRADLDGGDNIGEWRSLGGRFAGGIAAAMRSETLDLVARDADGAVHHRRVGIDATLDSDWQRVGGGAESEPVALALDDGVLAVFAIGTRGEVLMRRHRENRWLSEDWQVIEGVTGVRLGASAVPGAGLALAVVDKDNKFTTQIVRDARDLGPKGWEAQGDFQAWLTRTLEPLGDYVRQHRPQIAAE